MKVGECQRVDSTKVLMTHLLPFSKSSLCLQVHQMQRYFLEDTSMANLSSWEHASARKSQLSQSLMYDPGKLNFLQLCDVTWHATLKGTSHCRMKFTLRFFACNSSVRLEALLLPLPLMRGDEGGESPELSRIPPLFSASAAVAPEPFISGEGGSTSTAGLIPPGNLKTSGANGVRGKVYR